ncbi:hypothetical protein JCM3765_003176 [Sporobolomyces pararoseus]
MVATQVKPEPTKSQTSTLSGGIHASPYAKNSQAVIRLINDMRACGVATELDLPRIVLIGNQSAGKSSLVEAISGIKVPRDSGTCTRCPFEVRLQQSEEVWHCKISIRFETDQDGRRFEKIREIPFGDTIIKPDDVEGALRRAQLAVLNPSISTDKFAKATDSEVKQAKEGTLMFGSKKQLSFSTNYVCMDIAGPLVTDLAFIDLPGIIQNVEEGEDPANIELIKSLVVKHITGNALILLTLTMRDDLENQSAMSLAREADPEGKRTVGVLTKADAVQEGEHARWIGILSGQRARLLNGYFATKLPGAADLDKNLTFEEAREKERNFFSSTSPWSELKDDIRRRLGIPKLTAYLSEKLSSYIKTKLPGIRQAVTDGLLATENEIEALPPPPSEDPLSELLQLLQAFRADLDGYVAGSPNFERLIKEKNRIQRIFAHNIESTRPILHPFAATDSRCTNSHHYVVEKAPAFIDCNDSEGKVNLCREGSLEYLRYTLEMNLSEIRRHVEERKTRETPLNVPFPAKSSLMVETTKGWSKLVFNALEALETPLTTILRELSSKHFGRYSESGLAATAEDIVLSVATDLVGCVEDVLQDHLQLEQIPFTLNDDFYQNTLSTASADFKRMRGNDEAEGSEDSDSSEEDSEESRMVQQALNSLRALGYNVQEGDLPKLLPADEFADEIDVASHVIANWTVAYKRFVDNIPRLIDFYVLQKLPGAISTAFVQQLAHGGKEAAEKYLSESLEIRELRADLETKLARIGEAKQLLSSFGRY